MSAEAVILTAQTSATAAELIRNAKVLGKAKELANAHPVGAVIAGTGLAALAIFGGYKIVSKVFSTKS